MKKGFEKLVSYALEAIFGDGYRFIIDFGIKRNLPVADFYVTSPGYTTPADPLASRGGGVVDVLSFALRVVLLQTYRPKIEGPIILDEPFSQLRPERHSAVAALLKSLSERTGRQMIIVTQHDGLSEAGESIEVR